MSVGLIIVRAIVIIVPFITLLMLDVVSFLAPIFNPVMCISVADDIVQIHVVLISASLLHWSDATG
jgi:hypothetical protein